VTNTQGATSTISILDIYGFESFQHNSFEQLCINYANERLQQLFNHHLFKLEQEEYEAEDIDWSHVQFEDNQACLDLIESRPAGILSILDETCTVPKGTDAMLAEKLLLALESNPRFKREPKDPAVFHVHHYAGPVNYDTTGFLEKNRDVVHGDLLQLLGESNFQLPQTFSQHLMGANGAKSTTRGSMGPNKTVSSRFKTQLRELVARLNKTSPHFIRCIKPNTLLTHSVYDQPLVLEQLRSCGVLEVVRIARQGFPTRYPCTVFLERYAFLLPPALAGNLKGRDVQSGCKLIMNHFQIAEAMFQIGRSKLFLRAGQIGQMEDLRTRCEDKIK
jgi:myosin-5